MRKILIVDDNSINRQLLVDILEDMAECDVAENGRIAFKKYNGSLDGRAYDLVLLDVAMPVMDGVQFLTLVRENEAFHKIPQEKRLPVIMVTAYQERLKEVDALGCADYIIKPIDVNELLRKVEAVIGARGTTVDPPPVTS
jgi:CheY-like chemotaxis protein